MKLAKMLSWVPVMLVGGFGLAGLDGALFLTGLTLAWCGALLVAGRNGRLGRPEVEPVSHVRLVDPSGSEVEDLLRMSWWDAQRSRLDGNGRVHKVGVDKHSGLCWDGKRLLCQCGLADAEGEALSGGAA